MRTASLGCMMRARNNPDVTKQLKTQLNFYSCLLVLLLHLVNDLSIPNYMHAWLIGYQINVCKKKTLVNQVDIDVDRQPITSSIYEWMDICNRLIDRYGTFN